MIGIRVSLKNLVRVIEQLQSAKKTTDKRDVKRLKLINAQLGLLVEILDYVKTFDWLKKADYKEKIQTYWFSKLNNNVLVEQYGLTQNNANNTILYANDRLREKLGENTLQLILDGEVDKARNQFYVNSGKIKLENMILSDVFKILKVSSEKPVDVSSEESLKVLKFLCDYSVAEMQRRYNDLDKGSQQYIRYILEGKSPKHTEELTDYIKLLLGTLSYTEYEEMKLDSIIW